MKFIIFCWLLLIFNPVGAQLITTLAGNGTAGYSGNGGPAVNAQLSNPFEVAADNNGNIYIADAFNNTIRKVNSLGIISTFAGTGVQGYSGDGGPATVATLYRPFYVTVDNAGNVYFSDQNQIIIRKVNTAGIITTITGNLPGGYSGDGGPLINAQFGDISGIAFDNANNMYITDFINSVIRKVNTTGIISTFAGTGVPGFSGDGGPATAASIRTQSRVAIDNTGNVYIVSHVDNRIRVVNTAGIITTYAGTGVAGYSGDGGPASAATFNAPWHICFDAAGVMYVPDYNNKVIRKIDNNGIVTTYAGNGQTGYSGDGGPALLAAISDPCGTVCDNAGNLYVVQRDFQVVRKITGCLLPVVLQHPVNASICASNNVAFSINANNVISYQWQENTGTGWIDIADNATFNGVTTALLTISNAAAAMNGYQYQCKLFNVCGNVLSLPATLSISIPVTPVVSIIAASNQICSGTSTLFTAVSTNGGPNPVYQWEKNSINVGTNLATYTDNNLADGDIITCILTSSEGCVTSPAATGNNIIMHVIPSVVGTVTIITPSNTICFGSPSLFTAAIANGGSNPVFQWKKNGLPVGTNSPAYSDNTISNGDIIMCLLSSNQACINSPVINSNSIIMQVNQNPLVNLDKTPYLCATTSRNLNAGNYRSVLWNNGSTDKSLTVSTPGIYYVTVTDDNNCKSADTTRITYISPLPANFLPDDAFLCYEDVLTITTKTGYNSYQWSNNTTDPVLNIFQAGLYWLKVTDDKGCSGKDSIVITGQDCPKGIYIPNAFTPNKDGFNDTFGPQVYGKIAKFRFTIFNRWGQVVFQTVDSRKKWDGSFKGLSQDGNVFVWTCEYQFENSEPEQKRGTVTLIR
jgi:gliding motility-associated-like protein